MPFFSIILACYNAEKYLAACLDSILQQTFVDFEVIVVDDGSNDRTEEIINAYALKDNRIKALRLPVNRGPSVARNVAMQQAAGEWFALVDADDLWLPQRLETFYHLIKVHGENFVYTDNLQVCFDSDKGMIPYYKIADKLDFSSSPDKILDIYEFFKYGFGIKPIFSANSKDQVLFDEDIHVGEDTLFVLRLLNLDKKLFFHQGSYYLYRLTPNSLTNREDRFEQILKMLDRVKKDIIKIPFDLIDARIKSTKRELAYARFTDKLKKRQVLAAFKVACINPKIIAMFILRLRDILSYRLKAIIKGANMK